MSVDIEQAYIDYICSTPEKRRSLLDLNCSHVLERHEEDEGEDQILTNYCCPHSLGPDALTLSSIKADKKTRFLLSFEPRTVNGKACIDSQVEREKCANFWDFVDKEPLLSSVVKDGTFLHNSQPKILDDCCEFESDTKEPDGFENERDKHQKMRETRSKAIATLRKRREARLQLQLRSGQLHKKSKLATWVKDPLEELVFADMVPENGSQEFSFRSEGNRKSSNDDSQSASQNGENVPGKSEPSLSITTEDSGSSNQSSDTTSSGDVTEVLQNPEFPVTPSTVIHPRDSISNSGESDSNAGAQTAKNEEGEGHEDKTLALNQAHVKEKFTRGNRCIALPQSKNLCITDCNS